MKHLLKMMDLSKAEIIAILDLQITAGEEQRLHAQLIGTGLKRYAGASTGFLKDQPDGLSFQQPVGDSMFLLVFQLICQIQDRDDLRLGQIHHL